MRVYLSVAARARAEDVQFTECTGGRLNNRQADRQAGRREEGAGGGEIDRRVPTSPPRAGARFRERSGSGGRYRRGRRRHGGSRMALSPFTAAPSKLNPRYRCDEAHVGSGLKHKPNKRKKPFDRYR